MRVCGLHVVQTQSHVQRGRACWRIGYRSAPAPCTPRSGALRIGYRRATFGRPATLGFCCFRGRFRERGHRCHLHVSWCAPGMRPHVFSHAYPPARKQARSLARPLTYSSPCSLKSPRALTPRSPARYTHVRARQHARAPARPNAPWPARPHSRRPNRAHTPHVGEPTCHHNN